MLIARFPALCTSHMTGPLYVHRADMLEPPFSLSQTPPWYKLGVRDRPKIWRPQQVDSRLIEITITTSLLHHTTAQSYYKESFREKQTWSVLISAWIIGRLEFLDSWLIWFMSVLDLINAHTILIHCLRSCFIPLYVTRPPSFHLTMCRTDLTKRPLQRRNKYSGLCPLLSYTASKSSCTFPGRNLCHYVTPLSTRSVAWEANLGCARGWQTSDRARRRWFQWLSSNVLENQELYFPKKMHFKSIHKTKQNMAA